MTRRRARTDGGLLPRSGPWVSDRLVGLSVHHGAADGTPSPRALPVFARSVDLTHRPGRPRREETDRSIREAALRLLRECGPAVVTVEAVAAESGVAKTTIYRRHP